VKPVRDRQARPAARRPYAKPRMERVAIKPDEALLLCQCKNRPHDCVGPKNNTPRS
jgi:hypothetical protein